MGHIDTQALIAHLRSQFLVNWNGHHGISHWARVRINGLMLARETGANPHVVGSYSLGSTIQDVSTNTKILVMETVVPI
jgi:uncharacterized protein